MQFGEVLSAVDQQNKGVGFIEKPVDAQRRVFVLRAGSRMGQVNLPLGCPLLPLRMSHRL